MRSDVSASQTHLWRYSRITGVWNYMRSCDSEQADMWLRIYQDDEPREFFKLSKKKPEGAPDVA